MLRRRTYGSSQNYRKPMQPSYRMRSRPYGTSYRGYGRIRGRGKYSSATSRWKSFLAGIKDVGRMAGPKVRAALEDRVVQSISGRGGYQTNSLIDTSVHSRVQNSVPDETGAIVITNSEYIQDIIPSQDGGFETVYYQNINPGLNNFLPWLSQIAPYYEEYELIQCVFEVRSMVTEGNTTAKGTLVVATQYNPYAPKFVNKQAMENYDYASSCKVTETLMHGVECDPAKNAGSTIRYIRTGAVPDGQDLKTYDIANVQIAVVGAASDINIGELWCHYKVKLRKSKIVPPGSFADPNMLTAYVTNASISHLYHPLGNPSVPTAFSSFTGGYDSSATFNQNSPYATGSGVLYFPITSASIKDPTGVVTAGSYKGFSITLPEWVNAGDYCLNIRWTKSGTTDIGYFDLSQSLYITDTTYNISLSSITIVPVGGFTVQASIYFTVDSPQGTQAVLKVLFPGANTGTNGSLFLTQVTDWPTDAV